MVSALQRVNEARLVKRVLGDEDLFNRLDLFADGVHVEQVHIIKSLQVLKPHTLTVRHAHFNQLTRHIVGRKRKTSCIVHEFPLAHRTLVTKQQTRDRWRLLERLEDTEQVRHRRGKLVMRPK